MATINADTTTLTQRLVEAVARRLASVSSLPEATYRLQFQPERFGFRDAAAIADYLARLGVSHIYASPYLKTFSAATHGYAVVDYSSLHEALGSSDDYRDMVDALGARRLGQLLDIVPNHMAAAAGENAWWTDVLENGPSSPYAEYFDIDWAPVKEELRNKILLPVLGDQYGRVLDSGDLKLHYGDGAFSVSYYNTRLPLDPCSYSTILTHRLDELRQSLGEDSEGLMELQSILTALEYLPRADDIAPARRSERQREKEVIKNRLRRLTDEQPAIAEFISQNLQQIGGSPGEPHTFDLLDRLLDEQNYRLSHWKAAADEINYRRFFDINDLAAVCMEEGRVFEDSHRYVFDLLTRGELDGVRLDHIDGLFDPIEYLWRLQWGYIRALGRAEFERYREQASAQGEAGDETPEWAEIELSYLEAMRAHVEGPSPCAVFPQLAPRDAKAEPIAALPGDLRPRGTVPPEVPLYVVVEKILNPEEPLPPEWPVAGTTGYDYLNFVNRLFVDPRGLRELERLYQRFAQREMDFHEVAYRSKVLILRTSMSSELGQLAHRLNRISEKHRRSRDFTLNSLRTALREIVACFPIYRTYIRQGQISTRDRDIIRRTVAQAKRRNAAMDSAVFDFIRDVLLLEQPPELDEGGRRERDYFVGRFQQVTSPVIAKGIEDTAFYRYFPLVSLNEVGGEPAKGALGVAEFHRANETQQRLRPLSLTCSTTHDTKRSEDVRARINVLSEVPHMWRKAINRWARLNARHRRDVDGRMAPSRNDEYLFYQTLIGVWPLAAPVGDDRQTLIKRLQQYMEKSTHEAKEETSWISPNPEYDAAVQDFVAAALDDNTKNRFLPEFDALCQRLLDAGLYSALSQLVLRLMSPGVPDIYQGQELWDFSLVDPDNRRPVDFALRRQTLESLEHDAAGGDEPLLRLASSLAESPRDGRLKMLVTWKCIEFRRRHREMFSHGVYRPVALEGSRADHACAFLWTHGSSEELALVVAPRLLGTLMGVAEKEPLRAPMGEAAWGDTSLVVPELVGRTLRSQFSGERVPVEAARLPLARVFAHFPVAVLGAE